MKAKVWNDNIYPYSEMFRGDKITIAPGQFIEMDYMDAVQFRGTMNSISYDADGAPRPESYKKIRIEEIKDAKPATVEDMSLDCNVCNYKAKDQVDFAKHVLENHADSLADKSRDEAGKALQKALMKK